jgi:D-glycero-D-manno-heptose 1,7-bisphosphate phosphatase
MTPAILPQALFLDRDGTLNVDHAYVGRVEQLEWIPRVLEALGEWSKQGVALWVVSNQSGLARSKYTWSDLLLLERRMEQDLALVGAKVESWIYCPHLPEINGECTCRKPHSAMIQDVLDRKAYDPARCLMIGDRMRDLEAGQACGVKGIGVGTHENWPSHVPVYADFAHWTREFWAEY